MTQASRICKAIRRRIRSRFICFGTLRSSEPVNIAFGIQKGTPIDRVYIDNFFEKNRRFIKGNVLEIGEPVYAQKFGQPEQFEVKVLSFYEGEGVDYVGRLERMPQIANESLDCIILVQTLHYVLNMFDALDEIYRVLKPGGVVLCCVPGLSQISRYDMDLWGDRWRLTDLSARELFETKFESKNIAIETYGNALAATAFIQGIPAEKLRKKELAVHHKDYQILVTVVAHKGLS